MNKGIVLSLCDRTGVMVQPWADAGYRCVCVDIQHTRRELHWGGPLSLMYRVGVDIRKFSLDQLPAGFNNIAIAFAFPPCTHLANSGNAHKKSKGLGKLIEALQLVEACRAICEGSEAPWMLENPVGSLSTYWREPDYTFQPWEYTTPKEQKRTCIWAGNNFIIPPREVLEKPADVLQSCWLEGPSKDRGDIRSVTPDGWARAVFQANEPWVREQVA